MCVCVCVGVHLASRRRVCDRGRVERRVVVEVDGGAVGVGGTSCTHKPTVTVL